MQSVSSRIWTRVAVFISYDDNNYTTVTSTKLLYATEDFIYKSTFVYYIDKIPEYINVRRMLNSYQF